MKTTTNHSISHGWSATEPRKLDPAQREAILEAAAELAEIDYRHDEDLTDFDALGRDEIPGDSSSAQTR